MATEEALTELARSGIYQLHPGQAANLLGTVLNSDSAQTIVARVDWQVLREAYEFRDDRRLMQDMGSVVSETEDQPVTDQSGIIDLLIQTDPHERRRRLGEFLNQQAALVLGFDEGTEIDEEFTLLELGFDSLMAVQLRNIIRKNLEVDLELGDLFQSTSLSGITVQLDQRLVA